ncbi:hypothetical protein GEV33_005709 [Tenebrio molitor]|uniref:Uncharacterized protein n=1 Tax=Tenebrio molitor TaxID=7067 RepID=A0A8J6HME2_TENMO|nr:hypothetical protein GEV33_005709 [Tenebrio molitor]
MMQKGKDTSVIPPDGGRAAEAFQSLFSHIDRKIRDWYREDGCGRKVVGDVGERVLRSTPDWGETAANGDHLWVPTSVSGDFCYIGDMDCTVRT